MTLTFALINPLFALWHVYIFHSFIPIFLNFPFSDSNNDEYSNNHELIKQVLENLWHKYLEGDIFPHKKIDTIKKREHWVNQSLISHIS